MSCCFLYLHPVEEGLSRLAPATQFYVTVKWLRLGLSGTRYRMWTSFSSSWTAGTDWQRSCCLETNYCRDGESFNYFWDIVTAKGRVVYAIYILLQHPASENRLTCRAAHSFPVWIEAAGLEEFAFYRRSRDFFLCGRNTCLALFLILLLYPDQNTH